ncbi:MAG: hypothetical protein IJ774_01045 [Selenomonadaceae bacterium]|nr:hypothetical protein [Selenomonadaceae bacterium]
MTIKTFPNVKGIPNNTRWKIISDFLDRHGNDYETVFVTDTRDVIFQGDIFAAFDDCKNWLGFATELDDLRGTRTNSRINYNWLADCFGKAEVDKLADQKIICSGTIIGSVREMKIFCRELWNVLQHKTADIDDRSATHIFDQAATNWLVYNGRLPVENIFAIGVDGGEIFTNALIGDANIRGNLILRGDGGVPEVVHQYDRSDEMIRLVDELYRDRNFSFDTRFTDTKSTLEQSVCLLYADKTIAATRLFLKVFFAVTDFGKYIDALIKIWTLALRQKFSPTVETLELAAQNALLSVKRFSAAQAMKIHALFVRTAENCHAADTEFKDNFARCLIKIAENHLAAGNVNAASVYKKLLDELNVRS